MVVSRFINEGLARRAWFGLSSRKRSRLKRIKETVMSRRALVQKNLNAHCRRSFWKSFCVDASLHSKVSPVYSGNSSCIRLTQRLVKMWWRISRACNAASYCRGSGLPCKIFPLYTSHCSCTFVAASTMSCHIIEYITGHVKLWNMLYLRAPIPCFEICLAKICV
jgi:hypothetical protein